MGPLRIRRMISPQIGLASTLAVAVATENIRRSVPLYHAKMHEMRRRWILLGVSLYVSDCTIQPETYTRQTGALMPPRAINDKPSHSNACSERGVRLDGGRGLRDRRVLCVARTEGFSEKGGFSQRGCWVCCTWHTAA